MKRLLLVMFLVGVTSPVWAAYLDGNKLLNECNEKFASVGNMFCLGYIAGILDASMGAGKGVTGIEFCSPANVTVRQATDVVKKSLNDNPQLRHLNAATLVAAALSEAFPCPK
jgi:hypothetical protein